MGSLPATPTDLQPCLTLQLLLPSWSHYASSAHTVWDKLIQLLHVLQGVLSVLVILRLILHVLSVRVERASMPVQRDVLGAATYARAGMGLDSSCARTEFDLHKNCLALMK